MLSAASPSAEATTSAEPLPDAGTTTSRGTVLRRRFGPWGVPLIMLVMVAVFQSQNSAFLTVANIWTILEGAALPAMVACALTVILVMGEFDLSVQAVAGFSTTTFAALMASWNLTTVSAIAIMLGLGLLIGALTGWLVAYQGLNALVVTIGAASLLNGGEFWVSDSRSISVGIDPAFVSFVRSDVAGVPVLVLLAPVVALVLWALLDRSSLGRELRAIGANREAARFAGVNVRRTILIGFVITALVCTVAGMLYTGRAGQAYPLTGLQVLLPSFAACFIGAAMFRVGEFNIPGTMVGAVLASIVPNGLLLADVSGYSTYFFQGGILILAVGFARLVAGRDTSHA
ncbi:ABC transporter permease [Nocardioides hwasunensis]|uniref:ABC transporter permease n=1 Tax=Nocardioides hwasunensis TaxID=397258 RepID=A0ABR8MM29_9ACTN|nr:ABC transporter permease [Nocardioides hwasunensis]MBD3915584.1 ABC transporter permease [Nocardioides hwasunensis]